MIKISLHEFTLFIQKTFLEFLSDQEILVLYENMSQVDVDSFQKVQREEPPQFLYFVFQGEIILKNRSNGQELGNLNRGQSIDFKCLLFKFSQWQTDWFVEESASLLKIPYSKIEQLLSPYPDQLNYLAKLSQSVSLQRFKRDLLSLGITANFIKDLILKMKLCSFKEFNELEKDKLLFLCVAWGEVEVITNNISQGFSTKTLKTGDLFIADTKDKLVDFSGPQETRVFILPKEDIIQLSSNLEFRRLLDIHEQSGFKDDFNLSVPTVVNSGLIEKQKNQLLSDVQSKDVFADTASPIKILRAKRKQFFLLEEDSLIATEFNRSHSYIIEILLKKFKSGMTLGDLDFKENSSFYDSNLFDLKEKLVAAHFEIDMRDYISDKDFPLNSYSIVHTFRGFSLIKKVKQNLFELHDLDKGFVVRLPFESIERRIKAKNFICIKKWTGKRKKSKSRFNLDVCWDLVQDKKLLIGLSFIISFISYVLSLSFPIVTQYLMDQVVQLGRSDSLPLLTCILIFLTIYSVFIDWYGQRLTNYFINLLNYRLKSLFNTNLLERNSNVPDSVFITRVSEVETLSQYYFSQYIPALLNCILMTITLGVISLYSSLIGTILTCSLPISFIFVYFLRHKIVHVKSDYLKSKTNENQSLIQLFTNFESLKNLKVHLISRWKIELVQSMTVEYMEKNTLMQSLIQILQLVKSESIRVVTIVVSLKLYVSDQLTLGQVLALTMLAPRLGSQLQIVINAFFQYFSIRTLCEKLDELYIPIQMISAQKDEAFQNKPVVELNVANLNYAYSSQMDKFSLKNINLKLSAGKALALTGTTGAGKSTLAYILAGVVKPDAGDIQYRSYEVDVPISKVKVSLVEQEGQLFIGTILYNITLDDMNPDLKKATEIIQYFDFEDEIMQKTGGLSAPVQSQGLGFSPSFKNKILIARALYQNPDILILDEATCFFDPILEIEFLKKIKIRMKDKMLVLITNKVSVAMKCDQILYLNNGSVVERGNHRELIESRGQYMQVLYRQLTMK